MLSKMVYAVAIACLVGVLAVPAEAQLFPNAFWNKTRSTSACPGGKCPTTTTSITSTVTQSVSSGHWTHPGTISSHLQTAHGFNPAGMTREQMLSAHDALHEGRSVRTAPAVPMAAGEQSILKRSDFRQTFLKALKQAREKGEINAFQHGRLVVASLRPRELANIQAWVHENAIQEGLATTQAPDWNAIIEFIERLIPLIIQLIDLFGSNASQINDAQYVRLEIPQAELPGTWVSALAA